MGRSARSKTLLLDISVSFSFSEPSFRAQTIGLRGSACRLTLVSGSFRNRSRETLELGRVFPACALSPLICASPAYIMQLLGVSLSRLKSGGETLSDRRSGRDGQKEFFFFPFDKASFSTR